jgi:uncharacterized protein (TIGR03067 family)
MLLAPPEPGVRRPARGPIADGDETGRSDRDRLQGEWECASLERDGRVISQGKEAAKARVSFVGDVVTFEDDGTALQGTFEVDEDRRPKTFDLTVADAGIKETYPAGIYRLEGDIFELCLASPAAERPRRFATEPGSGRTLFVYRRIRSVSGRLISGAGAGRPHVVAFDVGR